MKTIAIKQYEIIVDDEDYQRVMDSMKWTPSNNGNGKIYFYKAKRVNGKDVYISLHRFLMDCPNGMLVDHINGNTFDNRKENLRICTKRQNNFNVQGRKKNKSKLKGISRYFYTALYQARIQVDGKTIFLGKFETAEEAHLAYCEASKKYHGEFGRY